MVNAQADAVPFEFGLDRERGMAVRELVRYWQPKLRSIYLLELACLQHRLFDANDPIPQRYWEFVATSTARYSLILKTLASHLQGLGESRSLIDDLRIESNRLSIISRNDLPSVSARIRVSGLSELLRQIEEQLTPLSQEVLHSPDWHDL
jgi:hypothetical protein